MKDVTPVRDGWRLRLAGRLPADPTRYGARHDGEGDHGSDREGDHRAVRPAEQVAGDLAARLADAADLPAVV
ncbi:hypothetical protein GA0115240_11861, partial [Streptomyces sp. DvalAA-14]|uniref:hypothetical protein n=1 Tax=unclassified Streptomyces TaxID=2593676 RepID=UPI00081AF4C5